MNINIDLGNGTVSGGGGTGSDGITPHIGANGNWFIGDEDTGVSAQGPAGADGATGTAGSDGDDGVGIVSIERTAGDGSAGTTDTYTITMTDGNTEEFTVYNGADGGTDSDHVEDQNNPHGVTAAQAGAFPSSGPVVTSYPNDIGVYTITANIFSNMTPRWVFGTLQIVRGTAYATHIYASTLDVYVGTTESAEIVEPTNWRSIATTDYAVNKAGDTMTGDLVVKKVENGRAKIGKQHTATADYGTFINDSDVNGNQLMFYMCAANNTAYFQSLIDGSYSAQRTILHTGNKDLIYTYGTDDIEAGSASPYETGHLHFVIE